MQYFASTRGGWRLADKPSGLFWRDRAGPGVGEGVAPRRSAQVSSSVEASPGLGFGASGRRRHNTQVFRWLKRYRQSGSESVSHCEFREAWKVSRGSILLF